MVHLRLGSWAASAAPKIPLVRQCEEMLEEHHFSFRFITRVFLGGTQMTSSRRLGTQSLGLGAGFFLVSLLGFDGATSLFEARVVDGDVSEFIDRALGLEEGVGEELRSSGPLLGIQFQTAFNQALGGACEPFEIYLVHQNLLINSEGISIFEGGLALEKFIEQHPQGPYIYL